MPLDTTTLYAVVTAAAAVGALLLWLRARRIGDLAGGRTWALGLSLVSAYFAIALASPGPPLVNLAFGNGLAVALMAAMHRGACEVCRRPFRLWPHAAATVVVTGVIAGYLDDAVAHYEARVWLVGFVTATQALIVAATMARADATAGGDELRGRRLVAAAFGAVGVLQLLRAMAHSPLVDLHESGLLARTPFSPGVAFGFLTWCLAIPVLVSAIHEARARHALRTTVDDLRDALAEVKTLRSMLPMCASCRRIRDDQDRWSSLEQYLAVNAGVQMSHGICPECVVRLYPGLDHSPTS